jgi:hypothetical protein
MKKLIVTGLVSTLIVINFQPRRSEAQLQFVAPAAFCAGTAGVGCAILAFTVVSGITYAIWTRNDKKQVIADKDGNIQKTKPGEEKTHELKAGSFKDAKRQCSALMGYTLGWRVYRKGGIWYCTNAKKQRPKPTQKK